MNLIKRITDKLRRNPLLVKPVVSTSNLIIVPESWFVSLLENSNNLETIIDKWEYGNKQNDKILFKVMCLLGYSKSATTIIKYNNRA